MVKKKRKRKGSRAANLAKARKFNRNHTTAKRVNDPCSIPKPKKRAPRTKKDDLCTTRVRIVCNGKHSKLKQCIRSHITRRKRRNAKPSCVPGTLAENIGKVRGTDGGYFRSVRQLHALNEQRARALNKKKNSKRVAECAQQTEEKRDAHAKKMQEALDKLLNVCVDLTLIVFTFSFPIMSRAFV